MPNLFNPLILALRITAFTVPFWLVVASVAYSADAQTGDAETNAAGQTNAITRLPAVVVTAQKEPADLESLPISITAVTSSTLSEADIRTVKEASIYAPNTFINEFTAPALSNPFFRGIGGSPANPGVTTFIDGVPQLNSYSSSLQFVDVNQIEFVRGPQGALFGRNTAGGLINITSRRPSSVFRADGEVNYGNFDYRDFRGSISGPVIGDSLSLGVAAGYMARDGFTKNDFNGRDIDRREDEFGKGQVLFRANDKLEFRFIAAGEHDRDGDYALGDLGYIRAHPNHVNRDFSGGFNHRDVAAGTLLGSYKGESLEITSISGGVWWKNHGLTDLDYGVASTNNFGLFATRDNTEEQHQFTQEFRFSSPREHPLKLADFLDLGWQAGVFVFSQSYNQDASNHFAPPLATSSSQTTADLDDWGLGLYGQLKLTAWEKLDAIAGIRWDYEDKRADLFDSSAALYRLPLRQHFSDNFSEVSPQFGLAYHITPEHMVYGSAARGYKAGGFNPIFPPGSGAYGTERSWNYEVGYKSRWLDDKLEAVVALYYIDWRKLQLNQPVSIAPGQFYISNAGAAVSKGVEFELKYRPLRGWDLFGSVGYTEAKFLSGSTAFNPNLNPPLGASQDVSGNHLPFAPIYTGNVGTEVFWQVCRQATLYARAEVTVYGDFKYDASNTAGQDTYALADFRAGVRGTHWFIEGWARNAFDEHYVPIAIQFGQLGAPSGYVGESGAPVTYGVRAGLTF